MLAGILERGILQPEQVFRVQYYLALADNVAGGQTQADGSSSGLVCLMDGTGS